MQSPFVNDLLLQNAYYECHLKQSVDYHSHFENVSAYEYQGSNRIMFTFFTHVLANQQVAFNM
jgi:hypothetical protein